MPLSYPATLVAHTTAEAGDVQGNFDAISTLLNTTKLDASYLQSGIITNSVVASGAAIAHDKLATTTPGYVLLGTTTTGAITATALSGDVTITGAGVTAIGSNKITNAMLGDGVVDTAELAAGAVETAKIEDLNVTTDKLAADAVTGAKLADDSVDSEHYVDGSIDTAHIANAQVTADKLSTGASSATVATNQTTTSTSYTDLSTTGPSVTVTIGANGLALVILTCDLVTNAGSDAFAGFVASGANTVAVSDNQAIRGGDGTNHSVSAAYLLTGLSAGSTTFKMQYRVEGGTGQFQRRNIAVIPL